MGIVAIWIIIISICLYLIVSKYAIGPVYLFQRRSKVISFVDFKKMISKALTLFRRGCYPGDMVRTILTRLVI